ncbi:uncharacterized protein MYCFIDRAFT_108978, partial [Pseudocercospora fijiensis CIRAD86]
DQLTVSTTSGRMHGKIGDTYPSVRQFLGIPYAQPPLGDLRWAAPEPLWQPDARIAATEYTPQCMQVAGDAPTIYNQELADPKNQEFLEEIGVSEDCLTLSVYAPSVNRTKSESLPVLIWVHGGGWQGGGESLGQIPTQWIDRTPTHIVVKIKYRLNIFGFPGGVRALKDWNLGYLDQRLAVEWVRDNIAAFGGDPSRITLWGESAGAGSVDAHTYAWPKDPIAKGVIQASNPPIIATWGDRTGMNFSGVAANLGCHGEDQLACMRKVPAMDIANALPEPGNSAALFYPTVDDKVVFANRSERILSGKIAKIPTIIGTNKNEGIGNIAYDLNGANQTAAHEMLLTAFFCPITAIIKARQKSNLLTYRFLYSGNFTNLSPKPWMGAYHGAEISMLFGTHPNFRGNSTKLQYETSHAMQDAWVAFARDPGRGLEREDWKSYDDLGEGSVRDFGDGVAVRNVSVAGIEGECD